MGTNKIGREKYIGEILIDNITRQDIYSESEIDRNLDEYFSLKRKIKYGDDFKSNYDEQIKLLEGEIYAKWLKFIEGSEPNELFNRYKKIQNNICLLYTSPSPRDRTRSRMPSSA